MCLVVLNWCVHLHSVWRIIVSWTEQLIADNVGDNAGWILCIWVMICLDHFAVSTCVVLMVSSFFGTNKNFLAMSFPLIICAAGIFVCLLATLVGTNLFKLWKGEVNWTQAQVSVPMISTIDEHCHFLGIVVCTAWDIFISMLSTQGCQD